MKARSLVLDLLGGYLRYRGGEVRLRGLVSLVGCLDVPEAAVRVVHDYRRFPFREPDLPLELLPQRWRGRVAHGVLLEAPGSLREPAGTCVTPRSRPLEHVSLRRRPF